MPKFIYTDEELMGIVTRQPLPITARRLIRIMNGRMGDNAAYRRLNGLVEKGQLLSRKFKYSHTVYIKVYGSGSQMRDMDRLWVEGGRVALAEHERDWYL